MYGIYIPVEGDPYIQFHLMQSWLVGFPWGLGTLSRSSVWDAALPLPHVSCSVLKPCLNTTLSPGLTPFFMGWTQTSFWNWLFMHVTISLTMCHNISEVHITRYGGGEKFGNGNKFGILRLLFLPRWRRKQRRKPLPLPKPNPKWRPWKPKNSAERYPHPCHPPSSAPRPWGSGGRPNALERASPGGTRLPTVPS